MALEENIDFNLVICSAVLLQALNRKLLHLLSLRLHIENGGLTLEELLLILNNSKSYVGKLLLVFFIIKLNLLLFVFSHIVRTYHFNFCLYLVEINKVLLSQSITFL